MRIVTANLNGIRSAAAKGFFDWFRRQRADVLCLQETKAPLDACEDAALRPRGFTAQFREARTRKGYSGVAIYSRREPDAILDRLGWEAFDAEGRYLECRFGNLSVVSLYLPSGSSSEERQAFKFEVMQWIRPIFQSWLASGRDYVLCGDWNIVRARKDIHNWTSNQRNSGCLPAERAWLNGLIADAHGDGTPAPAHGWVDSFRALEPEAVTYTWWSNRGAARAKDVGWRIDYQIVTPSLRERLRRCKVQREPRFSDHAPYVVDYAA